MRAVVFSNYVAKDVRRLGATIDVEHSNIKFMGNLMVRKGRVAGHLERKLTHNLKLNLWDCGG